MKFLYGSKGSYLSFLKMRIKNLFLFPVRLIEIIIHWGRYREEYEQVVNSYSVGDIIRSKPLKKDGRRKILLAPEVQEFFPLHSQGKADKSGNREMFGNQYPKGTLGWSFNDMHAPWVITKVVVRPFKKWIRFKVQGFLLIQPIYFFIKPYIPESIVWHEDGRCGRDTSYAEPSSFIEKFPEGELKKFMEDFKNEH